MPEDSQISTPASLIDYQDALLELLSSGLTQDEVLNSLKTDPRFSGFEDYIEKFDPDMVAVACELMSKWARRKPDRSNL